jgi:3-oxoacyl-[acyl-carrier-protein] synthase-3
MRSSRIAGLGHFVPERVVTNDELAELIDTSNDWIVQRTGIEERRWVDGDVGPAELALHASKDALEEAGVSASDLDMIIFATLSPDVNFPGSSCILQKMLGVPGVATLDIRNQCTGFVYGFWWSEERFILLAWI